MSVAKTGLGFYYSRFVRPKYPSVSDYSSMLVYDTYRPGTDDLAYIEKNIYTFGLVRDKRSV